MKKNPTDPNQLTIFDIPVLFTFDRFKESYCRHMQAYIKFEEDGPAVAACSFKDGKKAQCWSDWQPCNYENCPFFHMPEDEQKNKDTITRLG